MPVLLPGHTYTHLASSLGDTGVINVADDAAAKAFDYVMHSANLEWKEYVQI